METVEEGGKDTVQREIQTMLQFPLEVAPRISFLKYFWRAKAIISAERKKTCEIKIRFHLIQQMEKEQALKDSTLLVYSDKTSPLINACDSDAGSEPQKISLANELQRR